LNSRAKTEQVPSFLNLYFSFRTLEVLFLKVRTGDI
jgi:hypothetical protein